MESTNIYLDLPKPLLFFSDKYFSSIMDDNVWLKAAIGVGFRISIRSQPELEPANMTNVQTLLEDTSRVTKKKLNKAALKGLQT